MGFSDQISCFLFTNGLLLLLAGLNRSKFYVDALVQRIIELSDFIYQNYREIF